MTDFLSRHYFMNTPSQWLTAFAYIVGGIIIAKIVYFIFKRISKKFTNVTKTKLDEVLIETLEKPVIFAIAILGFYLGMNKLNMTSAIESLILNIDKVLVVICITWFFVRFVNAIVEEYMEPAIEMSESKSKRQLLPIITKVVTITIWIIGIIIAFNTIGYNLAGLIAGLGIGGLAFALAAKDYLQNIFGGISVFTDKPFRIDDRIKIDGFDGKVEEIGIRSSRIRTLSGSLVTIPNSIFISNSVENIALEPTRKIVLKLGLTYQTSPAKIKEAMEILKEINADNQDIVTDVPVVFFENFSDSSLVILFIYYIRKEADIALAQNTMNLEILERFEKAGLDFAYPTQTIYSIKQ
ncbi:mechanosensitive ion channel family protein [Kordia sp. YSTF-M3]|uniref:Mechanosensitive ion channel family protein n=1 Tax=Kordia aestuariivivens TaxID=2759037 RepID=A0ABR7Q3P1_9FLAO|nr:mechanosensitive ion channel family protein [Kordia aestuariivivens]MBC8753036.1 mechanosensitive ion channel family protein [Kordia aestuariivivens]